MKRLAAIAGRCFRRAGGIGTALGTNSGSRPSAVRIGQKSGLSTLRRLVSKTDQPHDADSLFYLFDEVPGRAHFSGTPWLMEIAGGHGRGNLLIFTMGCGPFKDLCLEITRKASRSGK
jgi:hypothetical protein